MADRNEEVASALKALYFKSPFYGIFSLGVNRLWDDEVESMGVCLNGLNYELVISPKYWDAHKEKMFRVSALQHELIHLVMSHPLYANEYENHILHNIACDIEVHCYMDTQYLDSDICTVDKFPELEGQKKMGTRWYYEKLKKSCDDPNSTISQIMDQLNNGQNKQNQQGGGSGSTTVKVNGGSMKVPSHDWKEVSEQLSATQKQLVQNQINYKIETAVQATRIGSLPGEVLEIIKRIQELKKSKFNWKSYLKRFVGNSRRSFTRSTRMKENRRIEGNPAIKIKHKQRILIAVDTSCSVGQKELVEFLNEITMLHKMGYDIDVIECDTELHEPFKFNPRDDFSVYGRGGTDVEPPCKYYMEHTRIYNCLIYFTDGYCYAPNIKGNILWVLPTSSPINKKFPGQVIKIEY